MAFAKNKLVVFALVFSSFSFSARADECVEGGAADQYLCFSDKLKVLDQDMAKELKIIIDNVQSEWGAEADKEIRERIELTQKSWALYRFNQCSTYYYTKAPVHSASDDLSATLCKIKLTKTRIGEIQNNLKQGY